MSRQNTLSGRKKKQKSNSKKKYGELLVAGYQERETQQPRYTTNSLSLPEMGKNVSEIPPILFASIICLLLLISLICFQSISSPPSPPTLSPVHGVLRFSNSLQITPASGAGLNDRITVEMQHISPPHAGEVYDGWLLSETNAVAPLFLGQVPVEKSSVAFTYQEPSHRNLLLNYSRFLLTEQNVQSSPTFPVVDEKKWRFQAFIPNAVTKGDESGYSLLSHVKHLLAEDPTLQHTGLQGGLNVWLYRNMSKAFEWSISARDDWEAGDAGFVRRQADRIVEYLDGQAYAFRDLPPGTPWLVDGPQLPPAGRFGLIPFSKSQTSNPGPLSYIAHVKVHLGGMAGSPDATKVQQRQAQDINRVLDSMQTKLQRARVEAMQLAAMTDHDIQSPAGLVLLDHLYTNVNDAYIGWRDERTQNFQPGEIWVNESMRNVATLAITIR